MAPKSSMAMKGGDTITLNPVEGRTVYIGGKKTPVKSLRPGDTLTFYIPEDRLTAAVMETPTAPVEEIAMAEPQCRAGGDDQHRLRHAEDGELLADARVVRRPRTWSCGDAARPPLRAGPVSSV